MCFPVTIGGGLQHKLSEVPTFFDSRTDEIEHSDSLHIDMVSCTDTYIFYAGSTTEHIYVVDLATQQWAQLPLARPNTHNAQYWQGGLVYNRSVEQETVYERDGEVQMVWPTPQPEEVEQFAAGDHARVNYTRGMVLTDNHVIVGTSPARIYVYSLGS